MTNTWVYIRSEPGLHTVGFYDPSGKWHADSDHDAQVEAASRVAYLNGGAPQSWSYEAISVPGNFHDAARWLSQNLVGLNEVVAMQFHWQSRTTEIVYRMPKS